MSEYSNIDTNIVDEYRKKLDGIVTNSIDSIDLIREEIENGGILSNAPWRVSLEKLNAIIGDSSKGLTLLKKKLKDLKTATEKIKEYQALENSIKISETSGYDSEIDKRLLQELEYEINTLLE